MKRKVLITGGQGMLATDLARVAETRGFEVVSLSHGQFDVIQPSQVRGVLEGLKPDYVIHTVGLGVDFCETNPEEAYRVHAWATGCIARHCQRLGATLVHISTCGLFGDEVRFYSEYDPVTLKTKYAHAKFLAELAAAGHCERTYNVRPGWLFGGTPAHKKNFVCQRFEEARGQPVLKSAGDKFGSPTYTEDLTVKLLELLATEEYGLYHISNEGGGSRYEYVKCIVEAFGLPTSVEMVDSSFYPRPSPVPGSEMLENLKVKFLGLRPLEPWQDAIRRYVSKLKRGDRH
ncbi:MAG: SDR family oxidoreductase [Candidatus Methylomirabilales bacterium]